MKWQYDLIESMSGYVPFCCSNRQAGSLRSFTTAGFISHVLPIVYYLEAVFSYQHNPHSATEALKEEALFMKKTEKKDTFFGVFCNSNQMLSLTRTRHIAHNSLACGPNSRQCDVPGIQSGGLGRYGKQHKCHCTIFIMFMITLKPRS